MSENSRRVAEAAKEDPSLLGTTNTGSREKQSPATASKVERSLVQAEGLSPTEVVGNTSNRFDRAIDEEFVGDADTTKAKMEDKGRLVPEVPNPENRFSPNNVGLDNRVEGQKVGKDNGEEVNRLSGHYRKDNDGLGRPEVLEGEVGTATDNGDMVPEVQAAEDNAERHNEGLREQEQVEPVPVVIGKSGAEGQQPTTELEEDTRGDGRDEDSDENQGARDSNTPTQRQTV